MNRLLFVVQRYGREVAGGAELHCRQFATRMAARGHQVDALTSCAVNYVDWANHYPAGTSELDGVTVHRLPVAAERDDRLFEPLNTRVVWGERPVPLYLQEQWMRAQGPYLPELPAWLLDHGGGYDVVIFFTYLYFTTWAGLPAASAVAPTVLHPTAHDEPALYLDLYRTMFHHPSAFAFSTEEEAALVARRFKHRRPYEIVGVGVEAERHRGHDGPAFREAFGLGLQMAALTALGAGANPIYLGADLPSAELLAAVRSARAGVLAISLVALPADESRRAVRALRIA